MTHLCVGNLTIIGSDNGLSPGRRQAITWTNVGILLIEPLGTNFSEMLGEIHTYSFKKIHLKVSSGKWWPFCLGLNMLNSLPCHHAKCVLNGLFAHSLWCQVDMKTNTSAFLGIEHIDDETNWPPFSKYHLLIYFPVWKLLLYFYWNLFEKVQIAMLQRWSKQQLDKKQVTSHYLNQIWVC